LRSRSILAIWQHGK